MKVINI